MDKCVVVYHAHMLTKTDYVLESKSIYAAFLHCELKDDSNSCLKRMSVEFGIVDLCINRNGLKFFYLPLLLFSGVCRTLAIHSCTTFSNFSLFLAAIFQIYEVKSATIFRGRLYIASLRYITFLMRVL